MCKNKRIVFMGTPEIASIVLEGLIESGFNIVAVVAQEDKPFGRKKVLKEVPTKVVANKYNIPVGTSNEYGWTEGIWKDVVEFTNGNNADLHKTRTFPSIGPIGPAARCLVIQLSNDK